ncbi:MAG: hypothetical protein ACE5FV_13055 [Woeseia sp.]
MSLEAFSTAASIALVATFGFLLAANSWHTITRNLGDSSSFPGTIMLEAAQRFRDDLDRLTRRLHTYLASALVFVVIFAVSYSLEPDAIFGDLPGWQLSLVVAVLAAVALYAACRFFAVVLARRRTQFVRDASIAAGHGLQKLSANMNRVFHDVPCGSGVIDNVIVGLHGVYAVNVVARRPGKDNRVRLDGDILAFAPGRYSRSLAEFLKRNKQLALEFGRMLGHEVRVRSVVAIPGWEIESQSSTEHLIVNECNLVMLRGWKDQNDYLMHEEVDELQEALTRRCTRS